MGEAEYARIRQGNNEARTIPGFLSSDPARAAAMAVALGALIFLVPELVPYYQQLSAEMQRADAAAMAQGGSDSSGADGGDAGGFQGDSSTVALPELGDLGAALSFDRAFDALSDSLDAAMDAADSSSGGDGGSDGGGGDGGGGE